MPNGHLRNITRNDAQNHLSSPRSPSSHCASPSDSAPCGRPAPFPPRIHGSTMFNICTSGQPGGGVKDWSALEHKGGALLSTRQRSVTIGKAAPDGRCASAAHKTCVTSLHKWLVACRVAKRLQTRWVGARFAVRSQCDDPTPAPARCSLAPVDP